MSDTEFKMNEKLEMYITIFNIYVAGGEMVAVVSGLFVTKEKK